MNILAPKKSLVISVLIGILICTMVLAFPGKTVFAVTHPQDDEPVMPEGDVQECAECHLDVAEQWSQSPHAHAYDDPYFQDRWLGMGNPDDCLSCHTTNFKASTGEYLSEGVSCEACHGKTTDNHPPEIVPVKADTEYCGSCHTTTLNEWRKTGHAAVDVGCMDCHNPHSQKNLFENPDEMCLNCHQEEDMGVYLEDLHVQKDIGCVDCHALVIPPEMIPDDGIVPTGHAFEITPATCVACHTDALHAGFSLPGYENGAKTASEATTTEETTGTEGEVDEVVHEEVVELPPEQRVQALEASLASRNMTNLFQGGVVGIVLGGTTAWIVARNVRRLPEKSKTKKEEAEDEQATQG